MNIRDDRRGFKRIKKPKQGPTIGEKQTGYDFIENWKNYSDKDKQIAKQAAADFRRPAFYTEARK